MLSYNVSAPVVSEGWSGGSLGFQQGELPRPSPRPWLRPNLATPMLDPFLVMCKLKVLFFWSFASPQDGAICPARDGQHTQHLWDGTVSSAVLAHQPNSGFVASNSGRSGATEVSGNYSRGEAFTGAAQVAARQHHTQQSRRSAGSSSIEGCQVGRGTESSGRSRFNRSARIASSIEGSAPCGAGPPRGSANRRVRGVHPPITKRSDRLEEERLKEQQDLDAALARIARLREEMARAVPVVVPPVGSDSTQPARIPDLVAELDRLRARVREMEVEREEARKKRSRSLSVPSPDLVAGPDVTLQEWGALHDHHVGQDKGAIMETLIQRGSSMVTNSNWFSPLA